MRHHHTARPGIDQAGRFASLPFFTENVMALIFRTMLISACLAGTVATVILSVQVPPLGYALLFLLAWQRWRGGGGSLTSHGSATLSGMFDIFRYGFLRNDGLVLGTTGYAVPPSKWQGVCMLLSLRVRSRIASRLFLAAWLGPRFSG